jgi:hypothetical protein
VYFRKWKEVTRIPVPKGLLNAQLQMIESEGAPLSSEFVSKSDGFGTRYSPEISTFQTEAPKQSRKNLALRARAEEIKVETRKVASPVGSRGALFVGRNPGRVKFLKSICCLPGTQAQGAA